MKEELGLAVVGCGGIGHTHLEALAELREKEGGIRLVATVDAAADRAEECAQGFGAEHHFEDYHQALDRPDVEAVVLALPNHLHAPVTIEAAEAGKHVLIEKPMARNGEEADRMVEAADRSGVTLMVAHSRRFIKNHSLAWERAEEIGNPFTIIYLSLMHPPFISPYWKTRALSGHLVYTSLGSHTVDFILWFFKGKKRAVRVFSEGYSNIPDTEGMDEASLIIGFDDGALATTSLSMNNRAPRIERIIITGEKGTMHMEHSFLPSKRSGMVGEVHSSLAIDDRVIWDGVQEEWYFTLQMKEFLSSIREDRPPLSDGRDVRNVLPILEAADRSAERHELIHLA